MSHADLRARLVLDSIHTAMSYASFTSISHTNFRRHETAIIIVELEFLEWLYRVAVRLAGFTEGGADCIEVRVGHSLRILHYTLHLIGCLGQKLPH